MAKIEWAMWANEQAVASCFIILLGGILAVAEGAKHVRWQIGAYGIVMSLLILFIEWPRSKRVKGNTLQRTYQWIPAKMVACFGVVGRNYFVRFVFYLLATIPTVFNLGTIMGGVAMLCACIIYLVAAVKGESWKPCERDQGARKKTLTRMAPPKAAPPRLDAAPQKAAARSVNNGSAVNVGYDVERGDLSRKPQTANGVAPATGRAVSLPSPAGKGDEDPLASVKAALSALDEEDDVIEEETTVNTTVNTTANSTVVAAPSQVDIKTNAIIEEEEEEESPQVEVKDAASSQSATIEVSGGISNAGAQIDVI